MADFKTALESLARGLLHPEALEEQLEKLLNARPQYATRLLSELDEAHERGVLGNRHYARIKRQINEFRRAHPAETEVDEEHDPDATVFERSGAQDMEDEEKTVKKENYSSEDATEMRDGGPVDPDEPTEIRAAGSEEETEIRYADTVSEEETEVRTLRKVDPDDPTAVNPKTMESEDVTEAIDSTGKPSSSQVDFDVSTDTSGTDNSGTISSLDSETGSTGTR